MKLVAILLAMFVVFTSESFSKGGGGVFGGGKSNRSTVVPKGVPSYGGYPIINNRERREYEKEEPQQNPDVIIEPEPNQTIVVQVRRPLKWHQKDAFWITLGMFAFIGLMIGGVHLWTEISHKREKRKNPDKYKNRYWNS